jgi:sec-independent protein translocase protein TatC
MQYLLELRRRLLYCLVSTLFLFAILCFFANPLYQALAKPLLGKLPASHLIATKISAPFTVPIKFALIMSLFLLIPLFFYHCWAFIAPALYTSEKKLLWLLLVPSVLLFYSGMLFAYFVVLPIVFDFFINTIPVHVELLPDISDYLTFVLQMLFAFGFAFEVPIIVLVIVNCSLVSLTQLKSARRYVIVSAFTFAMLVTPADVLSQILLAIPLWLLYELGLCLIILLPRVKDGLLIPTKPE